jgi:hypothetical protein
MKDIFGFVCFVITWSLAIAIVSNIAYEVSGHSLPVLVGFSGGGGWLGGSIFQGSRKR